jgi:hypothetical protein
MENRSLVKRNAMAGRLSIRQNTFRVEALRTDHAADVTLRKTERMGQRNLVRAVPTPPVNLRRQNLPMRKPNPIATSRTVDQNTFRVGALRTNHAADVTLGKAERMGQRNLVRAVPTPAVNLRR